MSSADLKTDGGQLLAWFRQEAGLTQTELAKRAQKSRSMIAQLEIGERRPSRKLLSELCQAMNVEPEAKRQLMLAFDYSPEGETPEQIEAFLRADKRLSYEQADAIVQIVREVYAKYTTDSDE